MTGYFLEYSTLKGSRQEETSGSVWPPCHMKWVVLFIQKLKTKAAMPICVVCPHENITWDCG